MTFKQVCWEGSLYGIPGERCLFIYSFSLYFHCRHSYRRPHSRLRLPPAPPPSSFPRAVPTQLSGSTGHAHVLFHKCLHLPGESLCVLSPSSLAAVTMGDNGPCRVRAQGLWEPPQCRALGAPEGSFQLSCSRLPSAAGPKAPSGTNLPKT